MAKGRGDAESKTRRDYLYQLADEVIYQDPVESYTNENMERGKVMEAEARSIYALEQDVMPSQVGFVFNHDLGAGCSRLIVSSAATACCRSRRRYPRLWVIERHPRRGAARAQGAVSGRTMGHRPRVARPDDLLAAAQTFHQADLPRRAIPERTGQGGAGLQWRTGGGRRRAAHQE